MMRARRRRRLQVLEGLEAFVCHDSAGLPDVSHSTLGHRVVQEPDFLDPLRQGVLLVTPGHLARRGVPDGVVLALQNAAAH